jgi:glutamyl-tRNA synthetase
MDKVGSSPGVFDHAKLDWLNGVYIRQADPGRLADLLAPFWDRVGLDPALVAGQDRAWLLRAIPLFVERAKTLREMAAAMTFLFRRPAAWDPKAEAKYLTPAHRENLKAVRRALGETSDCSAEELEALVRRLAEERGHKLVDYAQPIRVAMTGTAASPPLFPILVLLGRDEVLARLDRAIEGGGSRQ